jgi:hypothetical protein
LTEFDGQFPLVMIEQVLAPVIILGLPFVTTSFNTICNDMTFSPEVARFASAVVC